MYKVDTNIEMPSDLNSRGKTKYPFTKMNVGDSVFFEGARSGGKEYIAAKQVGNNHGKKFSARKEGAGLRIWRTE